MSTIRVTDLSKDVVALIGVGYEHLYSKMKQVLTRDELAFFAAPIRNPNSIEWSTEIQGKKVKYDHIDETTKSKLAIEIEDIRDQIGKKLALHPETKSFAKSIFTLPTKDSIVFIQKEDKSIVPVITEWGLRSAKAGFNGDPFMAYIDRPKTPRNEVNVKLSFHNDRMPPIDKVTVNVDNVVSQQKMDTNGVIRLGKIFIGSKINIQNPTTDEQDIKSFSSQEDQQEYDVMFDYKTSGKLIVLDQNENPQANTSIKISHQQLSQTFVSDKNGEIELPVLVADMDMRVTLADNAEITSTYHVQPDVSVNTFVFVIKTPEYHDIDIIVIDQNDDVVPHYPVSIAYQESTKDYISDADGKVGANKLLIGENIIVTDKNNPDNSLSIKIDKEKEQYYFRIQRDVPRRIAVQLLDHKSLPVAGASLEVKIGDKTFTDFVDEEGKIYFSEEGLADKSKGTIIARIKDDKDKTKTYEKSFTYTIDEELYIFKLKYFDKRWLFLLLLLLPLLLLIQQHKDIWVKTVDSKTEKLVPYIPVKLDYVRYSLYDKGKFFKKDTIERFAVSDSAGIAKFDSINYTWYSLFTKTFKKAVVSSYSDCYGPDTLQKTFHAMWHRRPITFEITAKTLPIDFYVIDAENKYPVANAKVYIYYKTLHESLRDSARTDAAGRVEFYNIPQCSLLDTLYASAYAYHNDTLYGGMLLDLATKEPLRRTFKLKPVKESIEFFVTDCRSNQPLPDAEATIYFDDETLGTETVITNVNGVGRGIYKDVHIKKKVKIVVNKPYYLTGEHDRGYTVAEFIKLGEKERTICLEPESLSIDFYNIDESNGNILAGVRNTITLISGSDTTSLSSTSNSNGVFQVPGITAGSRISIVSTNDPYYHKNDTTIKNVAVDDILADIANNARRTIPLKPKTFNLQFRTIEAEDGSQLPNVNLDITLNGQPYTALNNSGNGIFEIEATFNAVISIVAKAEGYDMNDLKIRNRLFGELAHAAPTERDIPMELPKCNFTAFDAKNTNSIMEWSLGAKSGVFVFEYYTNTEPDRIEVFAGRKHDIDNLKPIFYYEGATGAYKDASDKVIENWLNERINYTGGSVITVKVTGSTIWNYKINCPN